MKRRREGLVTALLCVVLFVLCGCAKEEPLYTAGGLIQAESETAKPETGISGEMMEAASEISETLETPEGMEAQEQTPETEAAIGYVYVCGAVNEPGVYPVYTDMRVCDAIALAGGFSSEADEEWLNQAELVSDGVKLYVYSLEETALMKESGMSPEGVSTGTVRTETGTGAEDSGFGTAETSDGKVNLNTATREELMTLPGIGESKADAIVAYRSEHGAFASIEEIQNISGIKSGVFSKIKELITV